MGWVVWLGVMDEFVIFCRVLCNGVLDARGYIHGCPSVGNSDVYGTTQDIWVGSCVEVDETFSKVGDFFNVCVCNLCLGGIFGV